MQLGSIGLCPYLRLQTLPYSFLWRSNTDLLIHGRNFTTVSRHSHECTLLLLLYRSSIRLYRCCFASTPDWRMAACAKTHGSCCTFTFTLLLVFHQRTATCHGIFLFITTPVLSVCECFYKTHVMEMQCCPLWNPERHIYSWREGK